MTPGHVLGALLLAVLAWLLCWGLAQTWYLSVRELPGAVLAWFLGGQFRRRLLKIIEHRETARRRKAPLPLSRHQEARELAEEIRADREELLRKYPETGRYLEPPPRAFLFPVPGEALALGLCSRDELRARIEQPRRLLVLGDDWQLTRLAVPGEPACDDPDCAGCQALRARTLHDARGGWAGQ